MSFKTIEEKIEDEVKYGFPLSNMSKKQHAEKIEEMKKIYLVPKEKMTFIIAHCIYNEAEFFKECLEDDLKMNDVDIIHIMDGAWEGYKGGKGESDDGTIEIVLDFMKKARKIGVEVIYESGDYANSGGIWKDQSEKRNAQLDAIDDIVDTPYYVFVKDGDEFFHFLSGKQNLWLKRDMIEWIKSHNNVGIVNANSWWYDEEMLGVRFFPSERRVHYYTERPMVVHDDIHDVVMDYNTEVRRMNNGRVFKFGSIMLINYWNLRNKDRIHKKENYITKQHDGDYGKCRFK